MTNPTILDSQGSKDTNSAARFSIVFEGTRHQKNKNKKKNPLPVRERFLKLSASANRSKDFPLTDVTRKKSVDSSPHKPWGEITQRNQVCFRR